MPPQRRVPPAKNHAKYVPWDLLAAIGVPPRHDSSSTPKGAVSGQDRGRPFRYRCWTASPSPRREWLAGSARKSSSSKAAITSSTGGSCCWRRRTIISATIANHCHRDRRRRSRRPGNRNRASADPLDSGAGDAAARRHATAKKPERRSPSRAILTFMRFPPATTEAVVVRRHGLQRARHLHRDARKRGGFRSE